MSQSPNEMFQLLEAWGLADLKAKFKANYVVIQALEYLTEADIVELIPKIGQRAIFRARLNQWRQQQKSSSTIINVPEPKKIKIEPGVEMKLSPEPLQQQVQQQYPYQSPIEQQKQPFTRVYGNINSKTQDTAPKPRAKRVNKKIVNIKSAPAPKIQSRVQQFIIGSPPSTASITTTPTPSTVISRLPSTTSVTTTSGGSIQSVKSPNTPLYNINQNMEFRRYPNTIPPPITSIPTYIRTSAPIQKHKPISTRIINSDNLKNMNEINQLPATNGLSPGFETDLTPFATSIIRVDTQYPNNNDDSCINSTNKFKRTTIIQKLTGDKNTSPSQAQNPKPKITPTPLEKLQSHPQIQNHCNDQKPPEFPKPKICIIPKEEPVEIIEDNENIMETEDWNNELNENPANSEYPVSEEMFESAAQSDTQSHVETEHDAEPNPEVEEFTLADATTIPELPDIMKDDLADSDHETNDNDNDKDDKQSLKNLKKTQGSKNSQNSQEVKSEISKLDIRNVLMNSKNGRRIIKRYVAEEILDEATRRLLVELIAQYCFDNKIHITPTYCKEIAEEIIEIFPNERMEDYWMRKGKKLRPPIYNKYHCIRRDFFRRKSLAASEQKSDKENTEGEQKSTTTQDNDYDDDDNLIIS